MPDAHQYTCSACAFQVRSENEDEIVGIIQDHARGTHDMDMSEQDVRDGVEDITV